MGGSVLPMVRRCNVRKSSRPFETSILLRMVGFAVLIGGVLALTQGTRLRGDPPPDKNFVGWSTFNTCRNKFDTSLNCVDSRKSGWVTCTGRCDTAGAPYCTFELNACLNPVNPPGG
jgi:hypothetical protein